MKILIISMETWRSDTNGGNVLTNIFTGFDAKFAQIYCSSGEPDNKICSDYFQMTDAMAIRNITKKESMGIAFSDIEEPNENCMKMDTTISSVKRVGNFEFLRVAREIVWELSDYKNDQLKKFVIDFDPDIIFAPCYGVSYMLSLTCYIVKITKKPVISYISDDSYSLRQFRFSPIFWLNRFVIRRKIRQTWKYYDLIYTMTSTQRDMMNKLGKPMKILCKSGTFNRDLSNKCINKPIRLIYAGGIYLNRWKTLIALVDAIKRINSDQVRFVLDIYTGNALPKRAKSLLNDGKNSFVHSVISYEQLMDKYDQSDIALHVEAFDLKNRLNVRMSFSTKIVDCLDSGCAVMAICDAKQGGYAYLKENDAAICVDSLKGIEDALKKIQKYPEIIQKYRKKAMQCGRRNHLQENIRENLKHDFEIIAAGE